jgi:DNA polymerase-3 subunit epsilon
MTTYPDLVFIDTETTGLDHERHEIIDLWARRVRFDDLSLVAEAGGLIQPLHIRTADRRALDVNRYSQERWDAEAGSFLTVWLEVEPVMAGATVVGSNPRFDLDFLDAELRRRGLRLPLFRHPIDTCSLAHPLGRRGVVCSAALGVLVEALGVVVDASAHSAKGDVLRSVEVYRCLTGVLK